MSKEDEAVLEAARRLDEVAPGWVDKVRGKTVDVSDASHCVLYHVFGEWSLETERIVGIGYGNEVFANRSYNEAWNRYVGGLQ